MKHQTRTLAQIASLASTAEDLFKSPQPLRRDKLGRQIFSDGSWLDRNALGGTNRRELFSLGMASAGNAGMASWPPTPVGTEADALRLSQNDSPIPDASP